MLPLVALLGLTAWQIGDGPLALWLLSGLGGFLAAVGLLAWGIVLLLRDVLAAAGATGTAVTAGTPHREQARPTGTTAGATISSGGTAGTLYALGRTGGSQAGSTAIKTSGQSNATTGTGAKTVPDTVLAAGTANQYVDLVYNDGANGDSNVVTVGPITTASALAFSGTIPTQNVTSGQSVDIDLSSYFSGTGFGTLSYASIGTSLTGSGLSLNTSTGHITGTAGSAQTVSGVQVRKGDSGSPASQASSNTFNIVIGAAGAGPTINTQPTTQTAKVGAAATWTMAATSSGGTLSRQWKFNGGNVGSDSNSYTRSGIVLGDHGATVVCRATDDNGFTDTATVSLVVAVTFAGTVPAQSGTEGGSFSLALASYFSGGLSRTYAVHSGTLPTGASLNASTGAITGTLGVAGSGSFVVRATDANSNTDDTGTISWTISAPGTGTLTSSTLCNNEGLVFADTPFTCFVRDEDSGNLILKKTGLVSDGQGVATFSDGSLPAAGTIVDVRWRNEDNGESGYELLPVE